jgi:cytochrome c553
MAISLTALTGVGPCFAETAPTAATSKAARILANSVCVHCHGPDGRSPDPAIPQLAGQQRIYLEVQIKEFLAQKRRDAEAQHFMWGISSAWLENDQVITDIAEYFATQSPSPGKPGNQSTMALGRQLYVKANSDGKLPSCAGCHGENAEGLSVFPRLAGQHAKYLTIEMQRQRVGLRDSPALHSGVSGLSDEEIAALATYLESK